MVWTVRSSPTSSADGVRGPVQVADKYHFSYADGTRYLPVGTTAYAWTHQDEEVEERTLKTLAAGPFNKLRMCVLPKSYTYNENEPPRYPFPGSTVDGWDTTRFNTDFFRHLEGRIAQLADLGIEVDLILLHPYDRWGFSTLPRAAHQRLVKYVVRRLAAYRNVWWSMANEYDLLPNYTTQDWEALAQVVTDNDPFGHLLSIHNGLYHYDQSRPWITHCSIQADADNTPRPPLRSAADGTSPSSSTNAATRATSTRGGAISRRRNSSDDAGRPPSAEGTSRTAKPT